MGRYKLCHVGQLMHCTCVRFTSVTTLQGAKKENRCGLPSNNHTHLGSVDLADILIALYRTPLKSKHRYLGIFAQLVSISVTSVWLL